MTHKNIYDKFLIEYDKANVTSSYPSFTKVEIAAILNKAYLALISQKFTGNNVRKVGFGQDGKALVDLQPLITDRIYDTNDIIRINSAYDNLRAVNITNSNFLYIISVDGKFRDGVRNFVIIPPQFASRYGNTVYNKPIIKNPACYIQGNTLNILYENYSGEDPTEIIIKYIKMPV